VKPQPLHPDVHALILERIDSVAQLDVLLLLLRDPAKVWTSHTLAKELRVTEPWTNSQLQLLAQYHLAIRVSGTPGGFRYGADPVTHVTVQELEKSYQSHPVAVVTLIYTKPNRALQNFADAFKLRKEPPLESGPGPSGGTESPTDEEGGPGRG
jgi:hypothetical protein